MKPLRPGLVSILLVSACVGTVDNGRGDPINPRTGAPSQDPHAPGDGRAPPPGTSPPASMARPPAAAVRTTRLARLSHRQWENTVRDLLRLPAPSSLSTTFPTDATGTFTNNGELLAVSDALRADYQTAAETLAQAYTNQNAVGWHNFSPIPWIIAGRARGYFTTGRFLSLANQGTNLNLLLNTLLGAVGVTKPDGSPVDDFGSTELARGRLTEIIA